MAFLVVLIAWAAICVGLFWMDRRNVRRPERQLDRHAAEWEHQEMWRNIGNAGMAGSGVDGSGGDCGSSDTSS